jgi:signal transduction histidine kinase
MSHELRTPLNAIIGHSEMLQEDAVDEGAESLVPDLKRVNAAGKHLLELINSILDLSKIEAGKMELQLEEFSVAGMVDDIRAIIQPLAEKNDNRLEVDCEAATGTMHGDLTKVRQVLFNLLSNACKFTEKGTVSLLVKREGVADDSWLVFTVSDTGIGLTPDQLGRLFQEFSQAHAATTRKYGGTGLGLALSRRLCRLMGGDITVASEAGRGSSFMVRLPANVTQIAERSQSAGTGGAGTVLVIDDEPPVRDLMRRFLGKEGFRVLTAAGGKEGLRIARHELRTPLNHIIGYSEMLLEDAADGTAAGLEPGLRTVHENAQRLLALVNEFLGQARAAAGEVDIARLSAEASAPLAAMGAAVDALKAHALVPGAENARQDLERIAVATAALRAMITDGVDSDSPRAAPSLQPAVASPAPARSAQVGLILVVDDNAANREVLARRLEREGHRVQQVAGGQEALDLLGRQPIDLVLLDVMMPEMDGYEVLQQLKADPALRHIPVLMISALDEMDSVVRCIELGAEDYLPKPFDPVLLRARIGACLEKAAGPRCAARTGAGGVEPHAGAARHRADRGGRGR